jgi:hypothetical protein
VAACGPPRLGGASRRWRRSVGHEHAGVPRPRVDHRPRPRAGRGRPVRLVQRRRPPPSPAPGLAPPTRPAGRAGWLGDLPLGLHGVTAPPPGIAPTAAAARWRRSAPAARAAGRRGSSPPPSWTSGCGRTGRGPAAAGAGHPSGGPRPQRRRGPQELPRRPASLGQVRASVTRQRQRLLEPTWPRCSTWPASSGRTRPSASRSQTGWPRAGGGGAGRAAGRAERDRQSRTAVLDQLRVGRDRAGLEQHRQLVELLIDRVMVTNGHVELRSVIQPPQPAPRRGFVTCVQTISMTLRPR